MIVCFLDQFKRRNMTRTIGVKKNSVTSISVFLQEYHAFYSKTQCHELNQEHQNQDSQHWEGEWYLDKKDNHKIHRHNCHSGEDPHGDAEKKSANKGNPDIILSFLTPFLMLVYYDTRLTQAQAFCCVSEKADE